VALAAAGDHNCGLTADGKAVCWGDNTQAERDVPPTRSRPYDNVVYEYHSYPPEATGEYGYPQSSIPVIIGEYGSMTSDLAFATEFFTDVEKKQIPNLAWDVSPDSNCAPDPVSVTRSTTLTPSSWGKLVKDYLLAH
jgi:hypothetical protein